MSAALYTVRVYFDAERGCVKAPGVYRQISRAPEIPGLPPLGAIDFAPETQTATLRALMGERREMRADESLAVATWLRAVQRGEA